MDVLRRELSLQLFEEHDRRVAAEAAFADPTVEQVVIEKPKRGGRREGAGRKKSGKRRDPLHRKRPELSPKHPVHVTMRMDRRRPELRNHHIYRKVNRVLRKFLGRDDFRVVHISIQNHHFHLLVEAADREALSRNMKSLAIRFQRAINGDVGTLFTQRYHAVQITTARQARRALAYVLNNWRRHRLDWDHCGRLLSAKLDEFSSAISFQGWRGVTFSVPAGYDPLAVSAPRTWLLSIGWRDFGLVDPLETPGPIY